MGRALPLQASTGLGRAGCYEWGREAWALRGKAAGLGIPAWAREGLGPGESGGIQPQPLVKSHLWAVLPSSVLIKGRSGLHTATSSSQFSSLYY